MSIGYTIGTTALAATGIAAIGGSVVAYRHMKTDHHASLAEKVGAGIVVAGVTAGMIALGISNDTGIGASLILGGGLGLASGYFLSGVGYTAAGGIESAIKGVRK